MLKRALLLVLLVVVLATGRFAYSYYTMYRDYKEISDIGLEDSMEDDSSDLVLEDLDNPFDLIEGEAEDSSDLGEEDIASRDKQRGSKPETSGKAPEDTSGSKLGKEEKLRSSDKKSYEEIVSSYRSNFESLQGDQESQLFGLIDQAKIDYYGAKGQGKSVMKLGITYINRAKNKENIADREFRILKDQMKSDLVNGSYNTAIVEEIDNYYKQKKRIVKGNLISKLKDL